MKRILYMLSLSVVLFACKKEYSYEGGTTSTSTYYITGKIDGTNRSFTFSPGAAYTASGQAALELTAFASADQADNTSISLDIYYDQTGGAQPPGVGTYDQQTDDYFVAGVYDSNDPNTIYVAGLQDPSASPLTITITSIANNVIQGTFSGAFYATDPNTGLTKNPLSYILITEGKFKLPLQ